MQELLDRRVFLDCLNALVNCFCGDGFEIDQIVLMEKVSCLVYNPSFVNAVRYLYFVDEMMMVVACGGRG